MSKDNPNSFIGIFGAMSLDNEGLQIPKILTNDTTYKFTSVPQLTVRSYSMETVRTEDNPNFVMDNDAADDAERETEPPLCSQPAANDEPYDPHDYCETDHPMSFWDSINLLLVVCAGPVILNMPPTFAHVGYALGFVLIFLLILLYAYNMHLIVWTEYRICKIRRIPNLSYPEVVYHAFKMGPKSLQGLAPVARYTLILTLKIVWFFLARYNYTLACRNLQMVIENLWNVKIDSAILLPSLIIPVLLLCWLPNLKSLVPFSVLANIANAVSIIFVVYYVAIDSGPWISPPPIGNIYDVPQGIGVILLSIKAAGIIMPIKNQMKRPAYFDGQHSALMRTYLPISLLYPCFSLICSLRFGNGLRFNVMENIPRYMILAQVGMILSTIAYILQFPFLLFVPVDLIWNDVLKDRKQTFSSPRLWEYTLKSLLVLLAYTLSAALSNVTVFVSICGVIASSIHSFMLPPIAQSLMLWKISKSKRNFRWVLAKNLLIVSFAVVLIIFGIFDCFYQIMKYRYHGEMRNN